jgi:HD-GYP domain-containing protein (c-di-GMP phosphodiesterase class II)
MAVTALQSTSQRAIPGFENLPLAFFLCPIMPPIDTYVASEGLDRPRLFASGSHGLTPEKLQELEESGAKTLLVRTQDYQRISKQLMDSLEDLVEDERIAVEERFAVVQSVVSSEVTQSLKEKDCGAFVNLADRIGTQIAQLVANGKGSVQDLFSLASHDTTTFVHSTNVAAYAVILADELGYYSEKEIRQIAIGAMLHDIGKRWIPNSILASTKRLTREERDIIETHPLKGFEELCVRADVGFGQLMMTYQHHEWMDGRGYPVAIKGDEIHPWAKLLSVVDVFDALTATRPYRVSMSLEEALLIIAEGAGTQFDTKVVLCWMSLFNL